MISDLRMNCEVMSSEQFIGVCLCFIALAICVVVGVCLALFWLCSALRNDFSELRRSGTSVICVLIWGFPLCIFAVSLYVGLCLVCFDHL